MGFMIKRSLAHLGKLHSYEAEIASGAVAAEAMLVADAPMEIQEAIKAVNRTAASMRNHFGLRIDSLMNTLVQHKMPLMKFQSFAKFRPPDVSPTLTNDS